MRDVREVVDHADGVTAERPELHWWVSDDNQDPRFYGPSYPMEGPRFALSREHFLRIPLPLRRDGKVNDDPELLEAIEDWIGRRTIAADGRVIRPPDGF